MDNLNVKEVLAILEQAGTEQTKKIWQKHGASQAAYGVRIGDMKKIIKQYKLQNKTMLAKQLYATGNVDAMYFAGLIVNPKELTMDDLIEWGDAAKWQMISESTVAWCAAESGLGIELAKRFIRADKEYIVAAGYATLASTIMMLPNKEIDINYLREVIDTIEKTLHHQPNRVRYTMNNTLIAIGVSVDELKNEVLRVAKQIGEVSVEMNGTACKVPNIEQSIMANFNRYGANYKKKKARC